MLKYLAMTLWIVASGLLAVMAAMSGVVALVLVLFAIGVAWTLLQIALPPKTSLTNERDDRR